MKYSRALVQIRTYGRFFVFKMLTINGEKTQEFVGKTLAEYLAEKGYEVTRLAVEKNGEIVPKAQYAQTILQDGDAIEIVRFVGGG